MMENDDTLIKNFMLANKHEIEDNGFSRGVIRRLPQPALRLSDILSVTSPIVCCALFYIFNSFKILFSNLWLSPLRFLSSPAYNVHAA